MTDVQWLTQEAYDRLTEELQRREGPMRKEIATKIALAREEGDLKENGGYHAAREDQGKNEARVRQIKHILEHAQIGVPEAHPDEVAHGKVVTIRFLAFDEEETFLLGSREEAAHASLEVYSPTSPIGSSLLGKRVGDQATYSLANGKEMTVEVVAVTAYTG